MKTVTLQSIQEFTNFQGLALQAKEKFTYLINKGLYLVSANKNFLKQVGY